MWLRSAGFYSVGSVVCEWSASPALGSAQWFLSCLCPETGMRLWRQNRYCDESYPGSQSVRLLWFCQGLTEHGLQTNKTTHKVVEVNGEIWFAVTSHQDLMEWIVQTETWNTQKPESVQVVYWDPAAGENQSYLVLPLDICSWVNRRKLNFFDFRSLSFSVSCWNVCLCRSQFSPHMEQVQIHTAPGRWI